MKTCPKCRISVHDPAKECPRCGRPLDADNNGCQHREDHPSLPPEAELLPADLRDYARYADLSAKALVRHASEQERVVDAVQAALAGIGARLDGLDARLASISRALTESQSGLKDVSSRVEAQGTRLTAIAQDLAASRSTQAQEARELSLKLSKVERDVQAFGPEAEAERMRQLARSLSSLWADAVANVRSTDDRVCISAFLENFAADVGLDVDLPRAGVRFNPQTMAPAPGRSASLDPATAVVEAIVAPGLGRDGEILQCAQVRLRVPTPSPCLVSLPNHSGNGAANPEDSSHE